MATAEQIAEKGDKYKTASVVGEDNVAREVNLSDAEIEAKVDAEIAHEAWIAANEYKIKRSAEYPSFADQFDLIYHSGINAWKAKIKETKDKYPKGDE